MVKGTTKAKSRRGKVGAVVAAVASVAGMVFAASPATATAAAYPTSDFKIPYGASYFNGTITWFNRSIEGVGSFRATGCRRVYLQAFAGSTPLGVRSSSTWCDRTGSVTLSPPADVVGGADNAWVYMTDAYGNYLHGQTCYRSGYCIDGRH
ncbi:MAG: hypothetical protein HOY78_31630 [Saccharothrix sp.]|nr:hypothetical protein [Saccharothrix sp.]